MDTPLSFIILGEPKSKKRPRVYRWSTVNPSKEDEERVAQNVRDLPNCPDKPFSGQLRVEIKFFKKPPKATPHWKFPYMKNGYLRPNTSPDVDNYVKFILDALNGILWADDRYIVEIHTGKFFTIDEPRIEIILDKMPTPRTKKEAETVFKNYDQRSFEIFFEFEEK